MMKCLIILSVLLLSAYAQDGDEGKEKAREQWRAKLDACKNGKEIKMDEKNDDTLDFSYCILKQFGCITSSDQWAIEECTSKVQWSKKLLEGCNTNLSGAATKEAAYELALCGHRNKEKWQAKRGQQQ